VVARSAGGLDAARELGVLLVVRQQADLKRRG
jgi:hypothetical protein